MRNNSIIFQYKRFFYSHENFTRILHDFTGNLFSITAQGVGATVHDVEIKGNPVYLTTFFY